MIESSEHRKHHNANRTIIWLVAIVCIHVTLGLVYWHYTPYGAPPDEGPHGLYVQQLAEQHRLPVFDPSDRANYEAHQPPLYYVLGVPFFLIGKSTGAYNPAETVRLLSMILGALSILVIYRTVRTVFPDEPNLGIAASGFVALLPTHAMLSSSVSNDILVELIFGLALLVMTQALVRGVTPARTVALGIVLGLALLTKTTSAVLFPIALLAYLMAWRRSRSAGRSVIGQIALLSVISLAIGGWWLVRNRILYGDILAMTQFQQAFEHTATAEWWLSHGFSVGQYWMLVLGWTFCSFWGVFGHMKVFMPAWTYVALGVASMVVGVASIRQMLEFRTTPQRRSVLSLYNALLLFVVLAFIGFNVSFFQAQGRYLYPAILPISVLWALGIRKLLPSRIHHWMPYIAVAVPLAAQIIAIATCIVPKMPYCR